MRPTNDESWSAPSHFSIRDELPVGADGRRDTARVARKARGLLVSADSFGHTYAVHGDAEVVSNSDDQRVRPVSMRNAQIA
jgi:hypothetical protein